MFDLNVKLQDGTQLSISVDSDTTIAVLKQKILEAAPNQIAAPQYQHLVSLKFKGRALSDVNATLGSFGIAQTETIHVVVRRAQDASPQQAQPTPAAQREPEQVRPPASPQQAPPPGPQVPFQMPRLPVASIKPFFPTRPVPDEVVRDAMTLCAKEPLNFTPDDEDTLQRLLVTWPELCFQQALAVPTDPKSKTTLLYTAARSGNHLAVQSLILRGADPNMQVDNESRSTSMHVACYRGNAECVKWLTSSSRFDYDKTLQNAYREIAHVTFRQDVSEDVRRMIQDYVNHRGQSRVRVPCLWFSCTKDATGKIKQNRVPLSPEIAHCIELARKKGQVSFSHPGLEGGAPRSLKFEPYPLQQKVEGAIINDERTLMSYPCLWYVVNNDNRLEPIVLEEHAQYDDSFAKQEDLILFYEDPEIGRAKRIVDCTYLSSRNEATGRVRPLVRLDVSTGLAVCGTGSAQWLVYPHTSETPLIIPMTSIGQLEAALPKFRGTYKVATTGDVKRGAQCNLTIDLSSVTHCCGRDEFSEASLLLPSKVVEKVTVTRFVPSCFVQTTDGSFQTLGPQESQQLQFAFAAQERLCRDDIYEYDLEAGHRRLISGEGPRFPLIIVNSDNDADGTASSLAKDFPDVERRRDAALSALDNRKASLKADITSPDRIIAQLALINVLVNELNCQIVRDAVALLIVEGTPVNVINVELPKNVRYPDCRSFIETRLIESLKTKYGCVFVNGGSVEERETEDVVSLQQRQRGEFVVTLATPLNTTLRMIPPWNVEKYPIRHVYCTVENLRLDSRRGLCLSAAIPGATMVELVRSLREKKCIPILDIQIGPNGAEPRKDISALRKDAAAERISHYTRADYTWSQIPWVPKSESS